MAGTISDSARSSIVPSEVVLLNAPRFADLRRTQGAEVPGRPIRVSGPQLAATALGAAVVASIQTRRLELGLLQVSGFLGLARRDVFELSGASGDLWPRHTLEALVVEVVGPRGTGSASLVSTMRAIVVQSLERAGGVVSLVHMSAVARGFLERDAMGADVPSERGLSAGSRQAADQVASMMADFRDDHPDAALALKQALGRVLATHRELPRSRAARGRPEASGVDLSSWQRLNRNPRSATDVEDD